MSDFFDDENFQDEFDEDSWRHGMNLDLWKRLLGYTLHYKKEVTILVTCAISVALSEVAFPLITKAVIDGIAQQGADLNLTLYGSLYAFFVVVIGISVGNFIWFGGKIRTNVAHDIRRDGFDNLQHLSFSYYDFRPVGWLMARMTSDIERLSNILAWGLLDLVWGATMMFGIAVAMLFMNVTLGLVVLSMIPVLAWLSLNFQRRILKSARQVRKTNSRITGSFNESIMGVRTTKAFVKEAENLNNFGSLTDDMYKASVLNRIQAALYLPLVLTLGSLASGLALVFGGLEILWGAITAGTLVAFLTYARHFFEPIQELANWFAEMQMAQASAERIISLIESEPAIQDSPEVRERMQALHADSVPARIAIDGHPDEIRQVTFENVGFKYDVGPQVLSGVDLTIEHGQNIAIVGSTGGGKTTLVNLLCRFYEPTEGRILLDGVDYRDRSLHWLQSNLGIVLQASHVFGGSIMENIRYGRLDATEDEILEASRRAGAHDFIMAMDDGYDTQVGEGGSKLSAGQKQLLSFARAILADPKILVMDEATSSVDTVTEQHIQKGLAELLKGRISVVIAHRLSTIRNADRIIVIEHGRMIESGNHAELMKVRGRYHKLYTQQSLTQFSREERTWVAV
ncbi:MAG: ABC transporter ATP-binding protein [Pseudomonadales bacterium]|nr:ABC transporter ATP-binding protein [Pseudomonadales bacterium]